MKGLSWSWIGRVAYEEALLLQRQRRANVIAGQEPEIVWMLEHNPVITTGRRSISTLVDKEHLEAHGIELVRTERGGLATYHGPGQLVVYPIVNCWERGIGAKGAVHAMEQSVIDWLAELGAIGERRGGFPGVWVGAAKICSIGMHFKKGVSMHGIAINLHGDLPGFKLIDPCGLPNASITSLDRILGIDLSAQEAAQSLAPHIIRNLMNPICKMTKGSRSMG